jgi:flagellar export protein FliJ
MRSPDPIHVLLRVRYQREEVEERKLAAVLERLKVAQAKLAVQSAELERITTTRLSEVQCVLPNTHHQQMEAHSRSLWRQCADLMTEIEKLREARAQQMSAYLSAHREREVVESLKKQRDDALEAARRLREQKLNEDLFLARLVAKRDTWI